MSEPVSEPNTENDTKNDTMNITIVDTEDTVGNTEDTAEDTAENTAENTVEDTAEDTVENTVEDTVEDTVDDTVFKLSLSNENGFKFTNELQESTNDSKFIFNKKDRHTFWTLSVNGKNTSNFNLVMSIDWDDEHNNIDKGDFTFSVKYIYEDSYKSYKLNRMAWLHNNTDHKFVVLHNLKFKPSYLVLLELRYNGDKEVNVKDLQLVHNPTRKEKKNPVGDDLLRFVSVDDNIESCSVNVDNKYEHTVGCYAEFTLHSRRINQVNRVDFDSFSYVIDNKSINICIRKTEGEEKPTILSTLARKNRKGNRAILSVKDINVQTFERDDCVVVSFPVSLKNNHKYKVFVRQQYIVSNGKNYTLYHVHYNTCSRVKWIYLCSFKCLNHNKMTYVGATVNNYSKLAFSTPAEFSFGNVWWYSNVNPTPAYEYKTEINDKKHNRVQYVPKKNYYKITSGSYKGSKTNPEVFDASQKHTRTPEVPVTNYENTIA